MEKIQDLIIRNKNKEIECDDKLHLPINIIRYDSCQHVYLFLFR